MSKEIDIVFGDNEFYFYVWEGILGLMLIILFITTLLLLTLKYKNKDKVICIIRCISAYLLGIIGWCVRYIDWNYLCFIVWGLSRI